MLRAARWRLSIPILVEITGKMIKGKTNQVAGAGGVDRGFLVMKAYALAYRDKPKDAYDICYCLDHYPGGREELAADWKSRAGKDYIGKAIKYLREKFDSVNSYGPGQVVEFNNSANGEEKKMQAQRAYQLVNDFLKLVG